MAPRQRPDDLRNAVLDLLGVKLSEAELAILAGRLRFDDQPALSQQVVANRLKVSQPHISNLERRLVDRLEMAAGRRRDERAKAKSMHAAFDSMKTAMADLGEAMPPRPLTIRRFGKRKSA